MTSEPPSFTFNTISLSDTEDLITKSEESFVNLPISVLASANIISPPSASNVISPATSMVKSPELKSISVPSIVMLSTTTPALAVNTPV